MPLELNQPVTKITTPQLGANAVVWSLEIPHNVNLGSVLVQLGVTVSATGVATKSVPTPQQACSLVTVLANGTPERTRQLNQIFGATGLNALNDKNNSGTVQYFQAGAAVTAVVTGITYGALPVLIGSIQDVAIQAALANNTATTAVFGLPFLFSEDYRKSYKASLAMALPTGISANGTTITSNIGGVIFQFAMQPVTGAAGTFSAATIAANIEYDNNFFVPSAAVPRVRMSKEKQLFKTVSVAGDLEMADLIPNVAGEMLQIVSLLTVANTISKVVIKQGQGNIIRTLTWADNLLSLRKAGVNVDAIPANRFDIIFDRNDDPTTGLAMDPNNELSIIATFVGGNVETTTILTSIYGPLD